ncbi:MAG: hypothetical protein EXS67_06585 [Candidatus Margulisbacteria bacterium]|nr:hypothetical protein [Candidatus Margulisiibacteriota bacterium]
MNIKGGFCFIATILEMKITLPVNITPTLRLEKATTQQIETIQKSLENKNHFGRPDRYYYEMQCKEKDKTLTSCSYEWEALSEDNWRYYIISFKDMGLSAQLLFSIANIIYPNLTSFLQYLTEEEYGLGEVNGTGKDNIGSTAFSFQLLKNPIAQTFDQEYLNNLQELFAKYNALNRNVHESILRAIDFNDSLRRLPQLTNLPVLGLFIIIEMLLTHNPNDREIGDSLNHQIKTKMAFISPRLNKPLDYSLFDSSLASDKVWSTLYEYRSCIAHGNHIDFTKGRLKNLKDANTAFDFLNAATKSLLAHAIIEPDVINGLKPI